VIADDAGGEIGNAPRQALVDAMRDAGFGDPKEFRGLAKIGTRMREPGRLVAATRGEVDLVVVVSLGSWYLSRADGGRVWYAAKGKVGAFNPWKPDDTGFPSFALEATANGVGDERAELAARTKFCADAGEKLASMLAKKS
jgi:hypothetical protein